MMHATPVSKSIGPTSPSSLQISRLWQGILTCYHHHWRAANKGAVLNLFFFLPSRRRSIGDVPECRPLSLET